MRRSPAIAFLLLALALPIAGPARSDPEMPPVHLNLDATRLAIRGYDPVAYFTQGAPTPGRADITADHAGATYRFASAGNRDAFRTDPARYLPAYGGFCAMGTALGRKVDGDPQQWRIVDDRLYLNYDANVAHHWAQHIPQNTFAADGKWLFIRSVPAGSLAN
ncbi:YHS domain-containing protein [Stella humosa]|uniref:YHS domain-containing protein n=1 Tax=Stella humosa TaxID=94 RepID=A0A3N1MFC9_9PROT|nr:YHS domain-containing (seleno)protein [Stella humosa]ROQ02039.1 YHS domain-containing protein [Stella humosa]BBK32429.1 hypothetical protein STHU_30630 [Stella humosa]